ncbi:MAG: DNA adenine methylase, partial [Myxococcota bacterium]|nr:DNA adenine methylase [Myxococcota bacterium]
PRAYNTLELRLPTLQSTSPFGSCKAHQMDAKQAAKTLKADLFYLDPPYNQHKYLGNYHIWESLVLWDKPDVYGVACKRMDVRERKSAFNSKPKALQAFSDLLDGIETRYLVVSFNDEGYISRQQMETLLQKHGSVLVLENDFKRYVGAQIGIHNPKGERVGAVTHLRNVEYLYIVARKAEDLKSLL